MRCGTSWLHHALQQHPQIQMADPKEPKFFDKRIVSRDWGWYESKFNPPEAEPRKPVRGEISTGYCKLARPSVAMIEKLMPELRIIFCIRNPVERTWSQALYEICMLKGGDVKQVTLGQLIRYFEQRRTVLYNDFERTIDIWTKVFGADRLFIGLYDRLCDDPKAYLQSILNHVGADTDQVPADAVLQPRILATQAIEIPDALRWYLSRRYMEPMKHLNDRLGGQLEHWLTSMAETEKPPLSMLMRQMANRSIMTVFETPAYSLFEGIRQTIRLHRGRQIKKQLSS